MTSPTSAPVRREVQALRAVAVALVVAYHLWPEGPVGGGYIGVDVFFVISGFLITRLLLRDIQKPARALLVDFWTRRAIRILPAAFVMLAAVGALGAVVLPSTELPGHWRGLAASALYVENLNLLQASTDYLATNHAPTAFQHAWSLSVEEQFYLVWPLLLLVLVPLARRARSASARRRALATFVTVLALASLAWSVWSTETDPARAYLDPLVRFHELAVGGVLAIVLPALRLSGAASVTLRWVGLAVIAGSGVLLGEHVAFPGAASLLPTLATAAVIAAGNGGAARDPLWRPMLWRPVRWLGDASYSVYLWHWPIIVLIPFLLPTVRVAWLPLFALLGTLLAAWLSRRYVEVPAQRWFRPRRGLTALSTVSAMAAATVAALVVGPALAQVARDAQIPSRCTGALAALAGDECPDAFTAPPTIEITPGDRYAAEFDRDCVREAPQCWNGTTEAPVVALVGDSHAQTFYPALKRAADAEGWAVASSIHQGCAAGYARLDRLNGADVKDPEACVRRSRELTRVLRELEPDLIVVSGFTSQTEYLPADDPLEGFRMIWREWLEVAPVVVLRDTPLRDEDPRCLAPSSARVQDACALPRSEALPDDAMTRAARGFKADDFDLVDLSDAFCDDGRCYPVVGGVPVYFDKNHMNAAFAITLADPLRRSIPWPTVDPEATG